MSTDGVRAALVLLAALAQVAAAFLPTLLGFENTIGSRSQSVPRLLLPAGYAFAIWLPLYAGSIWFALAHAGAGQRVDPVWRAGGWLALVSFSANAAWAFYVQSIGTDRISLALLWAILLPLLPAMGLFRQRPGRVTQWAAIPLFALAGWMTVACTVGSVQVADLEGWIPAALDESTVAAGALVLAGLFATGVAALMASLAYAGAVAWGLAALVVANLGPDGNQMIAVLAGLGAGLVLVSAAIGKVRSRS